MRLALVAVGQRQPAWAETACDDYLKRFPPDWRVELKAVKAEPRSQGKTVDAMKAAEAQRLAAACPKGARRVILDERGTRLTTVQLAERLRAWQHDGRDVALLIGGPDGLDAALKDSADEALRLSDLTLPHALARVLLAEALYRAWSLNAGHPYHRE
ncbi:MAG TPA: 23S rRNA (pseudouridine(1915)-N(3))-methyltransferase RlmH [Methylibium sp.]|nr:23S rRNA (pseudouridine(1915)-N(3))-methyltransferase RlmH [Methylibium sp.]